MPDQRLPDAIQWHQGMLLSPEHFQQGDLRRDLQFQFALAMATPFYWGVKTLRIDEELLLTGTYRVLEFEAMMPDGLAVRLERSDGGVLELDLKPHAETIARAPLTVYAAVATRASGRAGGLAARYVSIGSGPVADENTGEGALEIPRLRPRLQLLAGDPPSAAYTSFPIAQIGKREEVFALGEFCPPAFQAVPASPIAQLCQEIATQVRAKAQFLSERLRSPNAPAQPQFVFENRRRIQALVAALPQFEAAINAGAPHPFLLYRALCGLAGTLADLGLSGVPPVFRAYEHNNCWPNFVELREFAERMIREGIPEDYAGFPLRYREGNYELEFDPRWERQRLILCLRAQAGMGERELMEWGKTCLIASQALLPGIRAKRILGAARRPLTPGDDFIPPSGTLPFVIASDQEFIRPGETLTITEPGAAGMPRPSELVLYVKMAEKSDHVHA